MYSIKGSWVGQTFALASSTGSGGKKTRNRRSKEERKAMVESFIERYQKTNNGNFPSLNITHKEVGGSYYIVREIVREVIQENRVLGPGMLTTDEHKDYASLEHYPLGSIATEPQIQMLSSEESHVMTEADHNGTSESLSSNGSLYEHEDEREKDDSFLKKDNSVIGQERDGSSTTLSDYIDDETREYLVPSSPEKMPVPIDMQSIIDDTTVHHEENIREKEPEELILTNALPDYSEASSIDQLQSSIQESTEDEVEILAGEDISSGSNQPTVDYELSKENMQLEAQEQESMNDMKDGENEQEVKDLPNQIEGEVVVETFPLRSVPNNIHVVDQGLGEFHVTTNHLEEEKSEEDELNSLHEATISTEVGGEGTDVSIVDEETVPPAQSESTKGIMATNDMTDLRGIFSAAGNKPMNAPNGVHHDNLIAVGTDDSSKNSSPSGTTTTKAKLNVQHDSNYTKGINPTLDRINLETWEGRSKPDTNPLLSLVKSFITAFVKFWTE